MHPPLPFVSDNQDLIKLILIQAVVATAVVKVKYILYGQLVLKVNLLHQEPDVTVSFNDSSCKR